MLSKIDLLNPLTTIKDDDRFYLVDGEETNADLKSKFTLGSDIKTYLQAGATVTPAGVDTEIQFKGASDLKASPLARVVNNKVIIEKGSFLAGFTAPTIELYKGVEATDTSNEVWPIVTILETESILIDYTVMCWKSSPKQMTMKRAYVMLEAFVATSTVFTTSTRREVIQAGTTVTAGLTGDTLNVTFGTDGGTWRKQIIAYIYRIN